MTNVTLFEDSNTTVSFRHDDVAIFIFEYVFCVCGLAANLVVCCTILRYRKTTFSNTFYTLVVAVAIPDCVHLCSELFCAFPAVFYGLQNTPKWFIYSCGYFADAAFWAMAPLMLVIAANRYVAVCYFESYKNIFNSKRVKYLICFCFAFSFIIPSIMYGCECYFDFNYAWGFVCVKSICASFALNLNSVIANTICLGVVLIYVLIYFQLRTVQKRLRATLEQSEHDRRRRAKETGLMFQFGLISSVLVTKQVFFWIFLYASKNRISEIILNILANLNSCVSPFLYMIFGSEIRSRLPWRVFKVAAAADDNQLQNRSIK